MNNNTKLIIMASTQSKITPNKLLASSNPKDRLLGVIWTMKTNLSGMYETYNKDKTKNKVSASARKLLSNQGAAIKAGYLKDKDAVTTWAPQFQKLSAAIASRKGSKAQQELWDKMSKAYPPVYKKRESKVSKTGKDDFWSVFGKPTAKKPAAKKPAAKKPAAKK